jgi:feruloyl esterase
LITPQESINYFTRVWSAQSNSTSLGLRQTQDFYRLFMVPGMYHCAGGPGPNAFGNPFSGTVVAAPPPSDDAGHNIFTALQQWVEKGIAPTRIVATKYVQDQPGLGIQMTRPICAYPQVPRYSGSGPVNDEASFICADSPSRANQTAAPEYLQ